MLLKSVAAVLMWAASFGTNIYSYPEAYSLYCYSKEFIVMVWNSSGKSTVQGQIWNNDEIINTERMYRCKRKRETFILEELAESEIHITR